MTASQPDPKSLQRRNDALGAASRALAVASWRLLLIAAALVVVGLALGRLWTSVVLPVLLGLLLTTVLWPPVRLLRRRGVPAALAALLVLLTSVGALVGLVVLLAPQVTAQAQPLADSVAAGLEDLQRYVTGPPLNLGEEQVGRFVDTAIDRLQANAQSIATGVLSGVTATATFLVNAVLAIVLCFFFLKDGDRFLPLAETIAGPRAAPHVAALANRLWRTLGGFIRAQAGVGLVDAVAIGIGLVILGVPLALPLAVLIFFGAFIPIVGAFVTGALAALVALVSNGVTNALLVILVVLVVQQLEGNVLQPLLVGKILDLHEAVVILSVSAGAALAGIVGAFLSVPVVAVVTDVIRYVRSQLERPDDGAAGDPAEAADRSSTDQPSSDQPSSDQPSVASP